MSINKRIDKQIVAHEYNKLLLGKKKKRTTNKTIGTNLRNMLNPGSQNKQSTFSKISNILQFWKCSLS